MKNNTRFWVPVLALMLSASVRLPGAANGGQFNLELLAGMDMLMANGSASDYVPGTNDFPSTPAYRAPSVGIRAAFGMSPRFAWTFDLRYGFSAAIDRRDPSDMETVRVDAPRRLSATTGFRGTFASAGSLAIYAVAGAGIEYLLVEEKEFISDQGSRILVNAPEKPLAPVAAAGLGLQYKIGALALGLECRATCAFREPVQLALAPVLTFALRL